MPPTYPESMQDYFWAIDLARDLFEAGARPSEIIAELAAKGLGSIVLVAVGSCAFGISIPEAKEVGLWFRDGKPTNAQAIDDHLGPILAERRRG